MTTRRSIVRLLAAAAAATLVAACGDVDMPSQPSSDLRAPAGALPAHSDTTKTDSTKSGGGSGGGRGGYNLGVGFTSQ